MKLHEIAVAAAVLSFASAAVAAGNNGAMSSSTPSSGQSYSSGQSQSASPSSATSSGMSSQQNALSGASSSAEGQNAQTVREVQQALKQKGFDVGAIDGQMGPETQSALRDFQQSQGLPQSGNLDQQTLDKLGVGATGSSQGYSRQSQGSQASGTQGSMSSGASASSASRGTNEGMQRSTNGTATTPASPK